jgi:hypothetical protein
MDFPTPKVRPLDDSQGPSLFHGHGRLAHVWSGPKATDPVIYSTESTWLSLNRQNLEYWTTGGRLPRQQPTRQPVFQQIIIYYIAASRSRIYPSNFPWGSGFRIQIRRTILNQAQSSDDPAVHVNTRSNKENLEEESLSNLYVVS